MFSLVTEEKDNYHQHHHQRGDIKKLEQFRLFFHLSFSLLYYKTETEKIVLKQIEKRKRKRDKEKKFLNRFGICFHYPGMMHTYIHGI